MSYLPCLNPNCKSYGKPHPNCRCHGGMAEGGEITRFCSEDRAHDAGCEYFADGGQVEGFIPDDQFKPDPPAGDAQPEGFIPDDQFKPDDQPAGFIPDAEFKPDVGNDANADLPPDELQARMVAQAHPDGPNQYESLPQQALTLGEGAAQGVAGPLATAAEKGLGKLGLDTFSDEAINGRRDANPWEHHLGEAAGVAGSMAVGTGEAALIGKGLDLASKAPLVQGLAEIANLPKIGAAAVRMGIENGLITGGDEVSKWMLGQGDPQDAVGAALAHMGLSFVLGGAGGAAGGAANSYISPKIAAAAEAKLGGKLQSLGAGFGAASKFPGEAERAALDKTIASRYANGAGPDGGSFDLYKKGQEIHDAALGKGITKLAGKAGSIVGDALGASHGPAGRIVGGLVVGKVAKKVGSVLEKYAGPASQKYVAPLTFNLLKAADSRGIFDALNHAENMASGYEKVTRGVDGLFKGGTNFGVNAYGDEKARKNLDQYLNDGGVDQDIKEDLDNLNNSTPDQYAEGGEVKSNTEPDHEGASLHNEGVANHFPEHNVLLSAAKGRVSGYLNSLRPLEHAQKLPFDTSPDQATQRRSYHKAIDIANQPLGILQEIHKGTIVPEHVAHLKAIYPEVDQLLQKKLTEKVMQSQLDGKKPPYHVRQGLSLFMGAPLSAEMLPQNIQAAQAVFAKKAPQQPQGGGDKPKKSTVSLTKSDNAFLTGNQTLTARQQSKA